MAGVTLSGSAAELDGAGQRAPALWPPGCPTGRARSPSRCPLSSPLSGTDGWPAATVEVVAETGPATTVNAAPTVLAESAVVSTSSVYVPALVVSCAVLMVTVTLGCGGDGLGEVTVTTFVVDEDPVETGATASTASAEGADTE